MIKIMNRETVDILKKARSILRFHERMGVAEIPLTAGIEKFLRGPATASCPPRVEPAVTGNLGSGVQSGALYMPAPESALNLPLSEIYQEMEGCTKCRLHQDRLEIVKGSGPAGAKLFIIEDRPTRDEEEAAHPFAGEAGELFDKMLKAIGLERSKVYLTSIVKCRPVDDGDLDRDEIRTCLNFLARQIAAVNPVIICTMGPLSAKVLTGNSQSLFRFRGRLHDFHGIPLIPSFHPRFLLSNPEMKKASWADLQMILKKIA